MIDYDELREFLKQNLRLEKKESKGYYGEHDITIKLMFGDTVIDELTIDMPNTESRWQSSNC